MIFCPAKRKYLMPNAEAGQAMLGKFLFSLRGVYSRATCDGGPAPSATPPLPKSGLTLPGDCTDTVCQSKMDMMRRAFQNMAQPVEERPRNRVECPVDKDELGRAAWALLHTTAAYYPEDPSFEEKLAALSLVLGMSKLYPCTFCQADFEEYRKTSPPDVTNRESFANWVCELHNHVNARLGKPTFSCEPSKLEERWRTGAPECKIQTTTAAHDSLGQDD